MAGEPVLSQHHPDDPQWTAHLQQLLVDAGYDPGPVDGIFGSGTDGAVRQLQWDRGLGADGVVGPITWASLNGAGPATPGDGTDHEAGQGHGGEAEVHPVQASCQIDRFDDFGIEVRVTNENEWDWGTTDAAYDLVVYRDDVLVQQSNDVIAIAAGGTHVWTEPFHGTHFPGRYVAVFSVIDRNTNAFAATDHGAYER